MKALHPRGGFSVDWPRGFSVRIRRAL